MLQNMLTTLLALLSVLAGVAKGTRHFENQPNVIVVLTDDQDALLNSTAFQPVVMSEVAGKGITFSHAFANTPVCCPSRSSLLSGRYVHNHGARNNSLQGDCASRSWSETVEVDSLAVHMQRAGYRTLYAGKYLNNYGFPNTGAHGAEGTAYVPPGWTDWYALKGNSRYYNYTISDNGKEEVHGDVYEEDYLTDVLAARALRFIRQDNDDNGSASASASAPPGNHGDGRSSGSEQRQRKDQQQQQPFYMMIGTPAAHASFTPSPQYEATATGWRAPRTPTWNQPGEDRHQTVRSVPPMNDTQIEESDRIYRQRLGTLRSVDDMVKAILTELEESGVLDNTFIFYTADHGFHLGQLGMGFDKRQLYETDIRVPLFVRVPAAMRRSEPDGGTTVVNSPVSHVDLAPTILDLATGGKGKYVPESWDGLSYAPLLLPDSAKEEHAAEGGGTGWRNYTLIQYYGEGGVESCGAYHNRYYEIEAGRHRAVIEGNYISAPCDGMNNTYSCVRRASASVDDIFCQFTCFLDGPGGQQVDCPKQEPEGYGEYYDLRKDPYQQQNMARELTEDQRKTLAALLHRLENCSGQKECNSEQQE